MRATGRRPIFAVAGEIEGSLVSTPAGRIDRYGAAFILIALTIGLSFVGLGPLTRVIGVLLGGLALVFCLTTSDASPRIVAMGRLTAASAVVLAIFVTAVGSDRAAVAGTGMMGAALAFVTPIPIVRRLAHHSAITGHTVAGALCLYLLAGLCFAYLYLTIDVLVGPVFAAVERADLSDTIYFSFVTLATLGYGDLAPVPQAARLLAIWEAIGGQLYLVTVIAVLVANLGRSRREEP